METKTFTMISKVILSAQTVDTSLLEYATFLGYIENNETTPLEFISSVWQEKIIRDLVAMHEHKINLKRDAEVNTVRDIVSKSVDVKLQEDEMVDL